VAAGDLEIVRGLVDAWNADDWDAMADALHPDAVGIPPEGWPEGGTDAEGAEELLTQFRRLKDSWEEERVEVDEIREEGDEIVILGRWVTRGQSSGIAMQVPVSVMGQVRDGKVVRAQFGVDDSGSRPVDGP
jgi:ketosteroid isomerase-like protein